MAMAKWYIEIDSFWQSSQSIFIGPYANLQEAQDAAQASDAVPMGRMAADVKHNVRYEIHNTGQARLASMNNLNTVPVTAVPNDTDELSVLQDRARFWA